MGNFDKEVTDDHFVHSLDLIESMLIGNVDRLISLLKDPRLDDEDLKEYLKAANFRLNKLNYACRKKLIDFENIEMAKRRK